MAFDEGLADRVRRQLAGRPGFSERRMFGGVAFLIHGHMCCGVVKADLMVRLAEAEAASALREPHTRLMDFTGKPMKSMVYVEPEGTDSDADLERWVARAEAFARTLPPKADR